MFFFWETLRIVGGATGGSVFFFGRYSWGIVLHGEGVFQTPAAGGDCSGDDSAAGSGPVDVVGTGAGGGGAGATTGDVAGTAAVT